MPKWSCAHAGASLTILLALFPLGPFAQVSPRDAAGYQKIKLKATAAMAGDDRVITVRITNKGKEAALGATLTLVDHLGARVLPAQYSDNDLTVFPGEPRIVEIRYPANLGVRATVTVTGRNVRETRVRVPGDGNTAYLPYTYPQPWQQPAPPAPTVKSATVTLPKR